MRSLAVIFLSLVTSSAALAETIEVPVFEDTFVREGMPNTNEGTNKILRLQPEGINRILLKFRRSDIATAVNGRTVTNAKVQLNVSKNGKGWGRSGRNISLNTLSLDFTEGNGMNTVGFDDAATGRGSGSGATWKCPTDTNIRNRRADCSSTTRGWMEGFSCGEIDGEGALPWTPISGATALITNNTSGNVQFSVTSDVIALLAGSTENWNLLIKRTDDTKTGRVIFKSSEASANKPVLVLTVE